MSLQAFDFVGRGRNMHTSNMKMLNFRNGLVKRIFFFLLLHTANASMYGIVESLARSLSLSLVIQLVLH